MIVTIRYQDRQARFAARPTEKASDLVKRVKEYYEVRGLYMLRDQSKQVLQYSTKLTDVVDGDSFDLYKPSVKAEQP